MAILPINLAASAYAAAGKIGAAGGSQGSAADATLNSAAGAASGGQGFGDMVSDALHRARDTQYKTEAMSVNSVANQGQLHELVTAVTDADLTLQTVVSIRDKMISAYQDILKMPI